MKQHVAVLQIVVAEPQQTAVVCSQCCLQRSNLEEQNCIQLTIWKTFKDAPLPAWKEFYL